jgi:hypothetical protein
VVALVTRGKSKDACNHELEKKIKRGTEKVRYYKVHGSRIKKEDQAFLLSFDWAQHQPLCLIFLAFPFLTHREKND